MVVAASLPLLKFALPPDLVFLSSYNECNNAFSPSGGGFLSRVVLSFLFFKP